jgi:hypothetical protein
MFSLLSGVACGGSAAAGPECKAGEVSVPRSKNDPCMQDKTPCAAQSGTGVAMCDGATSKWGQCLCILPQGLQAANPAPPMGNTPKCGDGMVDATAGEQCEQGIMPRTCTEMGFGPGATGLVQCTACKYDMSMCASATSTGTAGTGAVGGAGTGM